MTQGTKFYSQSGNLQQLDPLQQSGLQMSMYASKSSSSHLSMIPQTMTDLVTKFENVPILGINIFQELRCYALKKVVNGKIKNTYLQ